MAEVPISRPTPPRPEDYVVVPGSQGPRRDFRISVGLREGWDAEGRVFDVSEAVRTARAWMKRRASPPFPACLLAQKSPMLGHATTAQSVRTGNPWPYSRAKRSTRTSVISPIRPSRPC
jgi:hypothetical protein